MAFGTFTSEQASQKIKQYCAYQERCHSEVRDKLYSFGLNKMEVEEMIASLIIKNYLNEERFAIHFAGGKFRMKKWGKNKIKQALKLRRVSDYCINKALKDIDGSEYRKAFQKIAEQKVKTLKSEKNIFIKKRKLQDFLLQRGFENDLIREALNDLC